MLEEIAEKDGAIAAEADRDNGLREYSPVRCMLAADKYARERMLREDAKPSQARQWVQAWIIGYAAWYEENVQDQQ